MLRICSLFAVRHLHATCMSASAQNNIDTAFWLFSSLFSALSQSLYAFVHSKFAKCVTVVTSTHLLQGDATSIVWQLVQEGVMDQVQVDV